MCRATRSKYGWQCRVCVCSYNCVMEKQCREPGRELQAGKSSHLWQAAGARRLFNTPANSCYVVQIRDHPNPNSAPTRSQGGFQWRVLGLFWAIPGSPSHLQLQPCGAVGDFARKSTLDPLPLGLRELSTRLNTRGHKHPKKQ